MIDIVAPGISTDGTCQLDNGKILGRISPYRVPASWNAGKVISAMVKHWMYCEHDHWCLAIDPLPNEQPGEQHGERGQVKVDMELSLGDVPSSYVDPYAGIHIYLNGELPALQRETIFTPAYALEQRMKPLCDQIVGCEKAIRNGRKVTELQILGLRRKFLKELDDLETNDKLHWAALLNKRLKNNGIPGIESWADYRRAGKIGENEQRRLALEEVKSDVEDQN